MATASLILKHDGLSCRPPPPLVSRPLSAGSPTQWIGGVYAFNVRGIAREDEIVSERLREWSRIGMHWALPAGIRIPRCRLIMISRHLSQDARVTFARRRADARHRLAIASSPVSRCRRPTLPRGNDQPAYFSINALLKRQSIDLAACGCSEPSLSKQHLQQASEVMGLAFASPCVNVHPAVADKANDTCGIRAHAARASGT